MTALNKQALREAAEKALPAMQRLLMMPNDELFDEALLNVDGDVDAANAFNLNFGPETALSLLDALEAAENNLIDSECHVAELEEALRDKQALLEAAEKHIAELTGQLTSLFERVSGENVLAYPDVAINWLADTIEGELDACEGALKNALHRKQNWRQSRHRAIKGRVADRSNYLW